MYCTKCGRKLEEGEVCTCTQNTQTPHMRPEHMQKRPSFDGFSEKNIKDGEWAKEKGTQAAGAAKDIFKQMLQIIKKPVSKTEEMALNNSRSEGLRLIITKAVLFVIIVCIMIAKLNKQLGGWVEIPYMSLVFLTLVMTLGIDWIEALLLKAVTGLFKGVSTSNAMYTVVGTRTVYEVMTLIVTAVLWICSESIAMFVGGALLLLTVYVEAASYRAAVDMNEDKKVFAFFIAKLCMFIVAVILILLIGKDMISSLSDLSYYLNY